MPFTYTDNSYLLFSVDQTPAPSFEIMELLFGKCHVGPGRPIRKHLHNRKAQWDLKSQLIDTFPQPKTYAHTGCIWEYGRQSSRAL